MVSSFLKHIVKVFKYEYCGMLFANSRASVREACQQSTMGKKNLQPIKPRKFGYDVSVRASERPSLCPSRLWGRGRGRGISRSSSPSPIPETKECHLSLAVFCSKVRKTLFSICHANKRSERLI